MKSYISPDPPRISDSAAEQVYATTNLLPACQGMYIKSAMQCGISGGYCSPKLLPKDPSPFCCGRTTCCSNAADKCCPNGKCCPANAICCGSTCCGANNVCCNNLCFVGRECPPTQKTCNSFAFGVSLKETSCLTCDPVCQVC